MISRSAIAAAAAALLTSVTAVHAATVTKISNDVFQPLRAAARGARVHLDAIPLEETGRSSIDLEEFQVWAPDGKILVHRESGIEELDPPATRFFRGLVNGDDQSFAFFALDQAKASVEGLIVTREARYAIARQARPRLNGAAVRDGEYDYFMTRFDGEDAQPETMDASWACTLDRHSLNTPDLRPKPEYPSAQAVVSNGITGTQSYEITLEVETDFNLYQNAGSDTGALTTYVTNLVGAASTIYNRDLQTNIVLSFVDIYTSNAVDPWTATTAYTGLKELGDVYHDVTKKPSGRRTTAVALLSGVNVGSGIAWEGIVGAADFATAFDLDGNGTFESPGFGGGYSWSGGIANLFAEPVGLGSVPDPDGTVSGTLYGMPSGTQNYWPLAELAHELGHNLGGHHTHCVAVSDAERAAAGFTDGSPAAASSNFVDHCFASERKAGCYGGATGGTDYVAGSAGGFTGTIMSYCQNVRVATVPQSRFLFGAAAEPSHHELDDYMLRAAGPIQTADGGDGGSLNIVNAVGTFTMSAITADPSLTPDSTGNVASVTATPGATFAWTIVNGTITGGQGTSSITYTAGAAGDVILRASAYKSSRVGITDTRTVPITAVVVDAPTGVVATATSTTSVDVSWNAVSGATSYNVWRMIDAWGSMQFLGNTAALTFTDSTAAPSTAYLYIVSAMNGATSSASSVADIATTIMFTDPTITPDLTPIKAVHFEQLRLAVNAARVLGGNGTLAPITFSPPSPDGLVTIRANHVQQLRTALNEARGMMGISQVVFSDPTLTAGTSVVQSPHITELRGGVE